MKRVAVVGAGHWGKNLVNVFNELGELAAVAEADPNSYERIASSFPDIPIYRSYLPILSSDIPAVAIATPAATHYTIAREFLLAGKDVFVEKPLTMSVTEGKELDNLAAEKGCVLMVGHLLLYQPAIQWMKKWIEEGKLGHLYSLHQRRAKLGKVRSVENVLWSLGVHDIAVLLYLIGEDPEGITVSGHSILQPDIEDDVYLHLSFSGNVQAHLHTSWLWPEPDRRLIVIGSKGMLVYDEVNQTVTLHHKSIKSDLTNREEGYEKIFEGKQNLLEMECSHFLECMCTRQSPLSDGKNGVAVIQVIERAAHLLKRGAT